MNATQRNHNLFEKTGFFVSPLPSAYVRNHPQKILVKVQKDTSDWLFLFGAGAHMHIDFLYPELKEATWVGDRPEWRGDLWIKTKDLPKNRYLLELIKGIVEDGYTELYLQGRQSEQSFYVTGIYPKGWPDEDGFAFICSQMGLDCKHLDGECSKMDMPADFFDSKSNCRMYYTVFKDRYPLDIQRYLDKHKGDYSYQDDIKRFIMTDWQMPKLNLPTADEALKILDRTLYSMENVKERLLEFLESVRSSGRLAYNLLLVGPPGTGKTTIMQAVAQMLGLPMSIVPMSACQDVENFTGFARSYSKAQEGLLTTALMSPILQTEDGCGESVHQIGQVLFLNELDKCSPDMGTRGSSQAALLRILDDNRSFFDVYHQTSIPLNHVVVVADANDLSTIQKPLLDRFEVIEVPPYTSQEKKYIFKHFAFPKALRGQKVDPSHLAITDAAIDRIISRYQEPGIRELNRVAERIVRNYLRNYASRKSRVYYTPKMVEPFLPKLEVRKSFFVYKPGMIRSAVLTDRAVKEVSIQCAVKRSEAPHFQVFGTDDPILQQELEASAICACRQLPVPALDVMVQLYGLPAETKVYGQLGFPVFVGILSAYCRRQMNGIYYGGTTLLGGLTANSCSSPDSLLAFIDEQGGTVLYTGKGFADRITQPCKTPVVEFIDAAVAKQMLFGSSEALAV